MTAWTDDLMAFLRALKAEQVALREELMTTQAQLSAVIGALEAVVVQLEGDLAAILAKLKSPTPAVDLTPEAERLQALAVRLGDFSAATEAAIKG